MEPHVSDLGVSSNFKSSSVFKCSANTCCICCGLHLVCTGLLCVLLLLTLCVFVHCLLYAVVAHTSAIFGHLLLCLAFVTCYPVSKILLVGVHCVKCTVLEELQHINELLFSYIT